MLILTVKGNYRSPTPLSSYCYIIQITTFSASLIFIKAPANRSAQRHVGTDVAMAAGSGSCDSQSGAGAGDTPAGGEGLQTPGSTPLFRPAPPLHLHHCQPGPHRQVD